NPARFSQSGFFNLKLKMRVLWVVTLLVCIVLAFDNSEAAPRWKLRPLRNGGFAKSPFQKLRSFFNRGKGRNPNRPTHGGSRRGNSGHWKDGPGMMNQARGIIYQ
ncbi:hypothetical protein BOX15_Mlig027405g1, partial [Macrostomum lignano]